jgi:hypothetical protein
VFGPDVASAIFSVGPQGFGSAVTADGDQVVFQVVDVTSPEAAPAAEVAQFAEQGLRDSLLTQLRASLLADAGGIRPNAQVLNQLLALDTSTAP